MSKDNQIKLALARIFGKKVEGDFEGGTVTSDGGLLFLRKVERRVGVIHNLVKALRDR